MATQKHLNRECEGGLLFEGQCSPHAFLVNFKVSACHVFILLVPLRPQAEVRRPIATISGSASTVSAAAVIFPASTHAADPSPLGPAASYNATHSPTLVAMPEASQVSSRQQRQCPAERINLTGARTTNWAPFPDILLHVSPQSPRIS